MKLSDIFKINDENKTRLVGLLTILISFWLVFYFIPEIFISLFNTLLGNLILIISVLLIYMNNRRYGLFFGFICLILFRFSLLSVERKREGFTQQSINDFINLQSTINKQSIFDMNIISTQASQEELDFFNKNGVWPWSNNVIQKYQDAVQQNPYIRTLPEQAVNDARTKYNQNAILKVLSYQEKTKDIKDNNNIYLYEKKDLPSGYGTFGFSSGLI